MRHDVGALVGRGVESGFLTVEEVRSIAREALARLPLDGRRVLVLIPDGTRTMPMPLLFGVLDEALAGAPPPWTSSWLSARTADERRPALGARGPAGRGRPCRDRRVVNHRWDTRQLRHAGDDPAREIEHLTGGRLRPGRDRRPQQAAPRVRPRDVCGPVFPHEVVGFSGGTKYLFPGIAGPRSSTSPTGSGPHHELTRSSARRRPRCGR